MRANSRQDARIYLGVRCDFCPGMQQTVRLFLLSVAALAASTSAQSGTTVPTVGTGGDSELSGYWPAHHGQARP